MFSGSVVDFCCPSVSSYSYGLVTFIKILKQVSRYYKLLSYWVWWYRCFVESLKWISYCIAVPSHERLSSMSFSDPLYLSAVTSILSGERNRRIHPLKC